MKKVFPVLIVALVLGPLGWFTGRRLLHMTEMSLFIKAPPEKKFMEAWESDIKHLHDIKALPAGFTDLRLVKVRSPSERLKKCFKQYPIQFGQSSKGHFILEIFMDELEQGGVLVQYDLVDGKSGNTIWELSRTFPHTLK